MTEMLQIEKQKGDCELSIFECQNMACEMEFPAFSDQASMICYCPRCTGPVVKNTGIVLTASLPDRKNLDREISDFQSSSRI